MATQCELCSDDARCDIKVRKEWTDDYEYHKFCVSHAMEFIWLNQNVKEFYGHGIEEKYEVVTTCSSS